MGFRRSRADRSLLQEQSRCFEPIVAALAPETKPFTLAAAWLPLVEPCVHPGVGKGDVKGPVAMLKHLQPILPSSLGVCLLHFTTSSTPSPPKGMAVVKAPSASRTLKFPKGSEAPPCQGRRFRHSSSPAHKPHITGRSLRNRRIEGGTCAGQGTLNLAFFGAELAAKPETAPPTCKTGRLLFGPCSLLGWVKRDSRSYGGCTQL